MAESEKMLNVRLDAETKNKLKALAENENRTISNYIKNFIQTEYKKLEKKGVL